MIISTELEKNIKFKLDYMEKPGVLSNFSESDLEWLERMRMAFKRQRTLSERQFGVLDDLWEKAT